MKTSLLAVLALSISPLAWSAAVVEAPNNVVERGADHRLWERTTYETLPSGIVVPHVHRVTELETGMHYFQNGQWTESREQIEPAPNGATATMGQHQVYFPSDIYQGLIEVVTGDGRRLRSRPLGVSLFDGTTTVLIAALTNSIGQILPSGNEVIYANAFPDLAADLLLTYRKAGIECDVILRERPLEPELYGLDAQTTRLQLWTEFFDTEAPIQEPDAMINGLNDTKLKFGSMEMVRGNAFLAEGQGPAVPVSKQWQRLEGRDFLIEEVRLADIQAQLGTLPLHSGSPSPGSAGILPAFVGQAFQPAGSGDTSFREANVPFRETNSRRAWEAIPVARRNTGLKSPVNWQTGMSALRSRPMKIAKAGPRKKGFVLDYNLVSSATNFTFKGDTTYYVSGTVNLSSTTTIEGGTVIKFTNQPSAKLSMGTLVCQTGPYRPAILTSKDDDSIGEPISGSTGTPTNYNGATFIYSTTTNTYKYLRCSYAGIALQPDNSDSEIWHSQFVRCNTSIYSSTAQKNMTLRNVLFSRSPVAVSNGVVKAEHVTADQVITLSSVSGPVLTNSILTAVTNIGASPGLYNCATNASGSGIYQAAGSGNYYLAAESTNRNAGTTNINSTLLSDLALKTTYPPIIYSNTAISIDTAFSPQSQRDSDTLDLGYHYDPLDYVFGGAAVSANLTFTAGTAVGWFELAGTGGAGYGIKLSNATTNTFNGTVTAPCTFARYTTVQEGNGNWPDNGWLGGIISDGISSSHSSEVVAQVTRFAASSSDPNHMRDYYAFLVIRANHCEFWSGSVGGYALNFYVTNCLMDRFAIGAQGDCCPSPSGYFRNCTLHGGSIEFSRWSGTTWPVWVENCAFDGSTSSIDDPSPGDTNVTYCDFNGFLNGTARLPMAPATHDVVITNFTWQIGPLGNFYQATNSSLTNAGSITANLIGLYHFTTQTNQVKETNSTVDIGFHYVATTNGVPIDTDLDGVPDYIEDANGNGAVDSGETDWQNATDLGLKVWITRPRNNSIIP